MSTVNHNFLKHPLNISDKHIQYRWPLVQCKPIHGFNRVHPMTKVDRRGKEMWARPEQGWIKINFDGMLRGNPGISGAGCVACDEEGKVLFKGPQRLQEETNNEAEVQAALLAVELANNMNILRVHLEGDSKVVVDAIVKGMSPS